MQNWGLGTSSGPSSLGCWWRAHRQPRALPLDAKNCAILFLFFHIFARKLEGKPLPTSPPPNMRFRARPILRGQNSTKHTAALRFDRQRLQAIVRLETHASQLRETRSLDVSQSKRTGKGVPWPAAKPDLLCMQATHRLTRRTVPPPPPPPPPHGCASSHARVAFLSFFCSSGTISPRKWNETGSGVFYLHCNLFSK